MHAMVQSARTVWVREVLYGLYYKVQSVIWCVMFVATE